MKIENCKVGFRCPKTLDSLVETADPAVRYCPECDRGVHLCQDSDELRHAMERGWCVVILTDQATGKFDESTLDDLGSGTFVGEVQAPYRIKDF